MFVNILTWLLLIALTVLFGWLVKRAWGSKRAFVKWPGIILGGLVTLLLALIVVLGGKGLYQLYVPYTPAPAQVTIERTPEQIARGEHLASVLCASCHTQNGKLPLSGGNDLSKDAGLPLGEIYPPNITPGGKIKDLTDNDIWRILRTGIEPGGRLTFMVAVDTRHLSDDDAKAVIAYLRSAPTVTEQRPPVNMSFTMALFTGAGLVPFTVPGTIQPVASVPKGATKEYGAYVLGFMDCHGCHGPTLSADGGPLAPPNAANLTLIVPNWSKDDFIQALRTGVDKTGHQIAPPMPWKTIGLLDDVELGATYEYLHALAPIVHPK